MNMIYNYKEAVKQSIINFVKTYPNEYDIIDGKICVDDVMQGVLDKFHRGQSGYVAPDFESAKKWAEENIELLAQELLDICDDTSPRDFICDDPFYADCLIRDHVCTDDFVRNVLSSAGFSCETEM